MSRALKVVFAFICLVLSIQAVVTTSSDVDHVKEASVTDPILKFPPTIISPTTGLNGPVVIASQPSAVRANLRKKEENEVELEDVTPFAVGGPYQVELLHYFPDLSNYYSDGVGVATIGPSVEYPNAHYGNYRVDMKLRKTIITFLTTTQWSYATFNGPVFTSLTSGANLPQPAYFISSTINTSLMTLTSTPTTIALNLQNVPFNMGDVIVIGW